MALDLPSQAKHTQNPYRVLLRLSIEAMLILHLDEHHLLQVAALPHGFASCPGARRSHSHSRLSTTACFM